MSVISGFLRDEEKLLKIGAGGRLATDRVKAFLTHHTTALNEFAENLKAVKSFDKVDNGVKDGVRAAYADLSKQLRAAGVSAKDIDAAFYETLGDKFVANEANVDALTVFLAKTPTTATPATVLKAAAKEATATKPTGVVDRMLNDPDALAKIGGAGVSQVLRTYKDTLNNVISRGQARGIGQLSDAERVALRAAEGAFIKESTEATIAGQRITAAEARSNFLDVLGRDFAKGSDNRREVERILGKQTTEPKAKAPATVRQEPVMAVEPNVAPKVTRTLDNAEDEAKKAAEKLARAESVIGNSLTDMHTVRTTNGKMPKQAFFAELQDALRDKGLLVLQRSEQLATTPAQVYDRLANRQVVTESEMRTLSEYFGRFHNDTKIAKELASQQTAPVIAQRGMAGIAETVARRIPVSEGRTSSTIAQSHAWETGETSFIRNRISDFQERPIRSTVSYAALAFTAFATQQTYSTIQNFQEPNYLGREIMAVVTPDTKKDIDDYVEYAHARFNSNVPVAMAALQKYYGVEKFDDTNKEKVVEALLQGPRPPFNPSPDITQSLIMFVSQRVYGKPVASTADLKGLQNEQITKGKDAETAEADKKAATIGNNAQAAINSPNPAPMLNIGGEGETAGQTAQQSAYSQYQVDGETFDNRLKGFSYNNPGLYNALADLFKKATKTAVKPEEELTSTNGLTQEEAVSFAEEAKTMLAAKKIAPEKAEQMVKILTEPTSGAPALGR